MENWTIRGSKDFAAFIKDYKQKTFESNLPSGLYENYWYYRDEKRECFDFHTFEPRNKVEVTIEDLRNYYLIEKVLI